MRRVYDNSNAFAPDIRPKRKARDDDATQIKK